jgi:hypothetical protein
MQEDQAGAGDLTSQQNKVHDFCMMRVIRKMRS